MSKNKSDVEVFHRINRLKTKAGMSAFSKAEGLVRPPAVKRAQSAIDEKEADYPVEVENALKNLQESWEEYLSSQQADRAKALEKVYNYSNHIKDLTSMYNHDLMSYFSLSLRDFCEKIDINKQEHQTIVRAHIDAMLVTFHENLRSDESPQARELMDVVAVAIKKYS